MCRTALLDRDHRRCRYHKHERAYRSTERTERHATDLDSTGDRLWHAIRSALACLKCHQYRTTSFYLARVVLPDAVCATVLHCHAAILWAYRYAMWLSEQKCYRRDVCRVGHDDYELSHFVG